MTLTVPWSIRWIWAICRRIDSGVGLVLIWPVVYDIHIYCGNKKTGNRLNQRNFVSHPIRYPSLGLSIEPKFGQILLTHP